MVQNNKMTLFNDNIPLVDTDDDVEKLKKKFSEFDPYYVVSACTKNRREMFDKLWECFHEYADKHFRKQYKHQFHQRTWEMYVGCLLLKNNHKVKTLSKGPDFVVDNNEYIECVACTRGAGIDAVPKMIVAQDIIVQDVPVDKMILRITSIIRDKHKKYLKYNLANKDKPFIIAVNSGSLQYVQGYLGIPLVVRALFGLEFLQIKINSGFRNFTYRNNVSKQNGEKVTVNIFTSNKYSEISAIIFSDKTVLNINNEPIFINNPFAKNPIKFEKYNFLNQWKAEKNKITKLYN